MPSRTWSGASWDDGVSTQTQQRDGDLVLATGSDSSLSRREELVQLQGSRPSEFEVWSASYYIVDSNTGAGVVSGSSNDSIPADDSYHTVESFWIDVLRPLEYQTDTNSSQEFTDTRWLDFRGTELAHSYNSDSSSGDAVEEIVDYPALGYDPYYSAGTWSDTVSESARITAESLSAAGSITSDAEVTVTVSDGQGNSDAVTLTSSMESTSVSPSLPAAASSSLTVDVSLSASSDGRTPALESVTLEYGLAPAAPGLTASYVADDQLNATLSPDTSGGTADSFNVEMRRDGDSWVSPAGGPSTVAADGSDSYSVSYRPASDAAYGRQVGVDSSFKFRARAANASGASDWTESEMIYTTPAPPRIVSVSRPDSNTVDITVEKRSEHRQELSFLAVKFREDTGSGYGDWQPLDNVSYNDGCWHAGSAWSDKGSVATLRLSAETTYQFDTSFTQNSRVQFRFRDGQLSPNQSAYVKTSGWVYHDYGTRGRVHFSDSFESGDLSAWDDTSGATIETGAGGPNAADTGVSGAVDDDFYAAFDAEGFVEKSLGDLSGESGVHVRTELATGSIDNVTEHTKLQWYDGSSWRTLHDQGWAHNEQGFVTITERVPDSWLSTDNRVRVIGQGGLGGGDQHAVDHVIVADVLDEYTRPAAPTDFKSVSGGRQEIRANWTPNIADLPNGNQEVRIRIADSGDTRERFTLGRLKDSATVVPGDGFFAQTPRRDGEEYSAISVSYFRQDRRGETTAYYVAHSDSSSATTPIPTPRNLSVTSVDSDSAILSYDLYDDEFADPFIVVASKDNLLSNPSFDADAAGTTNPTGWTYELHEQGAPAWGVRRTDDALSEAVFGSAWDGTDNTDGNHAQGPDTGAVVKQTVTAVGDERYLATVWGAPWGTARTAAFDTADGAACGFVGEDDMRLRLRALAGDGSVLDERATPWGSSLGYGPEWGRHTLVFETPANTTAVEVAVLGGDGNDSFSPAGSDAGVRIDEAGLYRLDTYRSVGGVRDTVELAGLRHGEEYIAAAGLVTDHTACWDVTTRSR